MLIGLNMLSGVSLGDASSEQRSWYVDPAYVSSAGWSYLTSNGRRSVLRMTHGCGYYGSNSKMDTEEIIPRSPWTICLATKQHPLFRVPLLVLQAHRPSPVIDPVGTFPCSCDLWLFPWMWFEYLKL